LDGAPWQCTALSEAGAADIATSGNSKVPGLLALRLLVSGFALRAFPFPSAIRIRILFSCLVKGN
jgi:hypothetical protein